MAATIYAGYTPTKANANLDSLVAQLAALVTKTDTAVPAAAIRSGTFGAAASDQGLFTFLGGIQAIHAVDQDECIIVAGTLTGDNIFGHAFTDAVVLNALNAGYASFKTLASVAGTFTYDHFIGASMRPVYGSTGLGGYLACYEGRGTINGPLTNYYGLVLEAAFGTGTVVNEYQVYIEEPVLGSTIKHAIHVVGGTSYFGGAITAAGAITSTVVGTPFLLSTGLTTSAKSIQLGNTGNAGFYFGIESSVGGGFFTGSLAYASVIASPANALQLIAGGSSTGTLTIGGGGVTIGGDLAVVGASGFGGAITSTVVGTPFLLSTGLTTSAKSIQLGNTGNAGFYFGIESSVGGGFFTGSTAYASVIASPANALQLIAGGTAAGTVTIGGSGVVIGGTLGVTGVLSIGNTASAVSPTAPNRTVTLSVGGVTLYLAAKTTND